MITDTEQIPPPAENLTCWFCDLAPTGNCQCGRAYCAEHSYESHCLICAVGMGAFDLVAEDDPLSTQIMLGLRAAAGDPYIVIPPAHQRKRPLSLATVEKVIAVLIKGIKSPDDDVRRRAAGVLAITTQTWPTMNPSPLVGHNHSISTMPIDQVRRWLLYTLKNSRSMRYEAIALAILERLRTADFHDLYPAIQENLKALTVSNVGTRVREVFETLVEFYPTHSPLVNEKCELMAYEQYAKNRGAAQSLQRIYGPRLKYAPILAKMLKKGTWLSSHARYEEWYYGEDEPV